MHIVAQSLVLQLWAHSKKSKILDTIYIFPLDQNSIVIISVGLVTACMCYFNLYILYPLQEDSISSIQQNLVVLLDVVETAASKIVQQRMCDPLTAMTQLLFSHAQNTMPMQPRQRMSSLPSNQVSLLSLLSLIVQIMTKMMHSQAV